MKMFFALVIALQLGTVAFAADQKIKRSQLPAAVEQAVKTEESKGAKAVNFLKETEDGKTLYEVEMKVNGKSKDVNFDENGKVVVTEEEVALASIPSAAQDAIKKAAGKGSVALVEFVNEEKRSFYEATLKGAKTKTLQVNADGTPVTK